MFKKAAQLVGHHNQTMVMVHVRFLPTQHAPDEPTMTAAIGQRFSNIGGTP